MTVSHVELLNLGFKNVTAKEVLIVESALEWVQANTILEFDKESVEDLEKLPSCVKLFILKFSDINTMRVGVASESIEGLSLSFDGSDKNALLWQYAEELLSPYLKSRIRFIPAQSKWI